MLKAKIYKLNIIISCCLIGINAFISRVSAQEMPDSLSRKRERVWITASAGTGLYIGSMAGLYQLWYKDYEQQRFHSFDDHAEWLQMDKAGHVFSAYYLGLVGSEVFNWAGAKPAVSAWLGGATGFLFLSGIELMDGRSAGWGFSWSDMAANSAGYLLAATQRYFFKEQRFMVKFSFYPEKVYAPLRPGMLGNNFTTQLFKNYNGQIYWISANIKSFLPDDSRFPAWLDLSAGYGANGLLGGNTNTFIRDGVFYDYQSIPRQRQFYLSLDLNLRKLKFKKKWPARLFKTIGFIKIPLPGFEFTGGETRFGFY